MIDRRINRKSGVAFCFLGMGRDCGVMMIKEGVEVGQLVRGGDVSVVAYYLGRNTRLCPTQSGIDLPTVSASTRSIRPRVIVQKDEMNR